MGTVILDMSISLDGFIAKPNGDDGGLNAWVFGGTHAVEAGEFTFQLTSENSAKVFKDFVERAGAFIVGKRAYTAAGAAPLFGLPTFILANKDETATIDPDTLAHFVGNDIDDALAQAQKIAEEKAVYIFGGAHTAQQYLEAGLIDEIHLNHVPVMFTEGIRLFDNLTRSFDLDIVRVVEGVGVTHIVYRV
ncbi:MAG: dihydrofolate reductase family protein [Chloroflexota bacterium]